MHLQPILPLRAKMVSDFSGKVTLVFSEKYQDCMCEKSIFLYVDSAAELIEGTVSFKSTEPQYVSVHSEIVQLFCLSADMKIMQNPASTFVSVWKFHLDSAPPARHPL